MLLVQISLGDARSYYITTARNDLGVIFATSEAGETHFISLKSLELCLIDYILQVARWNLCHGRKCAVRKQVNSRNENVQSQKACNHNVLLHCGHSFFCSVYRRMSDYQGVNRV